MTRREVGERVKEWCRKRVQPFVPNKSFLNSSFFASSRGCLPRYLSIVAVSSIMTVWLSAPSEPQP